MANEAEQMIKRVTRCGDDYYAILGVDKGASEDELKKAYRKLALRLHPDKCQEKGTEEAFKKVGEAFGVLSDKEKRSIYDQCGVDGLRGGGGGGAGGINPEDIFQAFFGGQGGGFPGGATFVRQGGGMGPGFQTFHFSSGGPGMGGVHFSNLGGHPGVARQRQRRPAQEEEEERVPQETPPWLKAMQALAGQLGPLLPLAIMGLMGVFMLLLGTILQFFMQRAFIILPIMYLTEGKVKMILLSSVVLLAVLGIM